MKKLLERIVRWFINSGSLDMKDTEEEELPYKPPLPPEIHNLLLRALRERPETFKMGYEQIDTWCTTKMEVVDTITGEVFYAVTGGYNSWCIYYAEAPWLPTSYPDSSEEICNAVYRIVQNRKLQEQQEERKRVLEKYKAL